MHEGKQLIARWGERILALLVDEQDSDALLGDFAEEYTDRVRSEGSVKAGLWYWRQIAGSSGSLLWLKLYRQYERRTIMNNSMMKDKRFIWIGLLALLPALLIIVPGLLQSGLGITALNDNLEAAYRGFPPLGFLIHPAVLLGGLLIALGLNVLPALDLRWESNERGLTAMVTIKKHWLHWAVVGFSLLLLATLLVYSLTENFTILPR